MVTVRCTQKLLRRLRPTDDATPSTSTTVLGDWYANVAYSRPQQLVVCVSERTLLPVVVPVKDLQTFVPRLAVAVREVLLRLGVDPGLVQQEQAEMQRFAYGRTQNRRVLGSLNEFMFMLGHYIAGRPEASLIEHSVHLAHTPCSPLAYGFPDRETLALFKSCGAYAGTH